MILFLLLLTPLIAAALIGLMPENATRKIALIGTAIPLLIAAYALWVFDWNNSASIQFAESIEWLPEIGLNLSVGVDSVALLLVALTALLGPICVLASKTAIKEKIKTYFFWLLVLQSAMVGVFAARDLLLFYICFEFTLLPMYVLIALYGSSNRAKAATKFFLYTFTGSMIALAGLVYVVWFSAQLTGHWTLDIGRLQASAMHMSGTQQGWVLLALLLGFAVKVPVFPLHTWLPLAHTEAPTAGSVILAGVLLKLGTYGIYRFALPMTPLAIAEYAPAIAILAIVGIVYAGLICWVQTDVKKLVAYSSVSHLGFCVLGLVAVNSIGLKGSILYMINHGLSTGALFLLIGMVYERYHTRSMRELGGLAKVMPVWATFMVFFTMASVGLPGLNGFVSEFFCLVGTFQADSNFVHSAGSGHGPIGSLGPWYAFAAGTGMVVAAIYLLYMVGKVVFGPLVEPRGHQSHSHGHGHHGTTDKSHESELPRDLSTREIGILLPLAALCIFLGVYPKPVIDALDPAVNDTIRMVSEGQGISHPPAPIHHDAPHDHALHEALHTSTSGDAP